MTNMLTEKPAFAVTGSNGKTTALFLTSFILQCYGLKAVVLDNPKNSLAFEKQIDRARRESGTCLLMEVPLEVLRQRCLTGSMFQAAALMNIAVDHVPGKRSRNNCDRLISSFFRELPEGAKAVFNADDPHVLSLADEGSYDLISYALNYPNAMVVAADVQRDGLVSSFDLVINGELQGLGGRLIMPGTWPVRLPAAGDHNIANALVAAIFALLLGVDPQDIADAFGLFPGLRRRLEVVHNDGEILVMDDSAQNPAAIRAALAAASGVDKNRVIILHAISGGMGETLNRLNALELAAWMEQTPRDILFVTRSMYHTKNKYAVQIGEEKAFFEALREKGVSFAYYPDLPDALESVLFQVKQDDLVLLMGGAGLNRASELLAQITGCRKAGTPALVTGEIAGHALSEHAQGIAANPT
jgi:UDP-N-acetylmuramoyl-L-alanyl-D-glutamate--2,6-diaminopimelate ligase